MKLTLSILGLALCALMFILALILCVLMFAVVGHCTITTMALPRAVPNQAYSFQLTDSGACSWSVVGSLPTGFSLSVGGLLTGSSATPFDLTAVTVACGVDQATFYLANQPNRSTQYPHTVKSVTLPYIWQTYTPEWLRNTVDVTISGNPSLSSASDLYPMNIRYVDGGGWYPALVMPYIVDLATSRGWANYEDIFVHQNVDYNSSFPVTWSGMDQFDVFDQPTNIANGGVIQNTKVRNGVLLWDGASTYTDLSVGIYLQQGPYTVPNGNYLYVGYTEPFDLMKFTLGTVRVGGTAAWTYWNGTSWASLTLSSDGTSGLTSSGNIRFTPPSDWAKTAVNGSHTKYWVRLAISGTTTAPRITQLKGDDWVSAASTCLSAPMSLEGRPMPADPRFRSNPELVQQWLAAQQQNQFAPLTPGVPCTFRGWNASDGNRVNVGTPLEYNPSPPSNATAHFRYQGRATGYWNNNYIFAYTGATDSNTSEKMFAQAKNQETVDTIAYDLGLGHISTGVFFDNIGGLPAWLTNTDISSATYDAGWGPLFSSLTPLLHSSEGANFTIGANLEYGRTFTAAIESATDITLEENTVAVTQLGPYYYATYHMDPLTKPRILAMWDAYHFQAPYDPCGYDGLGNCKVYKYWPQGDRSPMHALGGFLMGLNSNTLMEYNMGGWFYNFVDEVLVWDGPTTTLASPVVTDTNDTLQTVTLTSGVGIQNTPMGYVFKIGNDIVSANKVDATHYTLKQQSNVYLTRGYSAGTTVQTATTHHLSSEAPPAYSTVAMWLAWFPAMAYDFGQPDTSGFNAGVRGVWYTGQQVGQSASCSIAGKCPPIERRDFTKAMVLQRTMGDYDEAEWDTPSSVVTLPACSGCQWQRLHADGTLDPAVTTVALTGNETAIFVKVSASPTVANPVFSPGAGGYTSAQTVTLTDATSGSTICWKAGSPPTTDGNGHCVSGTTYGSPILVLNTQTLYAIATKSEYTDSAVVSAAYTINVAAPEQFLYMPSRTEAVSLLDATQPGVGTAFMVDTVRGDFSVGHTVQVIVDVNPSQLTMPVEGSLDAVNWFTLATIDAADQEWVAGSGEMIHVVNKPVLYIRCNLAAFTSSGDASCLITSGGFGSGARQNAGRPR